MNKLYELKKRLFLKVRDIPFEIIPGTSLDYQKALRSIEIYKKGSCTAKHFYLGRIYQKIGIEDVLYVTYIFFWDEQNFINNELKNLAKRLPEQYHLALYVDGQLVDATFDKYLAPIFPVNEFENCKVSVEYIERKFHLSPQERIEYVKLRAKNSPLLRKFYRELNKYCRKIRKKNEYSRRII